MTIEPKKRAEIVKAIKKLVLAHHINVGGVDYAAWTARVDERTPELLNAADSGDVNRTFRRSE